MGPFQLHRAVLGSSLSVIFVSSTSSKISAANSRFQGLKHSAVFNNIQYPFEVFGSYSIPIIIANFCNHDHHFHAEHEMMDSCAIVPTYHTNSMLGPLFVSALALLWPSGSWEHLPWKLGRSVVGPHNMNKSNPLTWTLSVGINACITSILVKYG